MVKVINQKQRDVAVKVIKFQALVTLAVSLAALLLVNKYFALSVMAGSIISLAGNSYFALKVFRYSGARASQQIAKSFYSGETGKFVITFVSFAVLFKWLDTLKEPANALGLLSAFAVVHVSAWFVPLLIKS